MPAPSFRAWRQEAGLPEGVDQLSAGWRAWLPLEEGREATRGRQETSAGGAWPDQTQGLPWTRCTVSTGTGDRRPTPRDIQL